MHTTSSVDAMSWSLLEPPQTSHRPLRTADLYQIIELCFNCGIWSTCWVAGRLLPTPQSSVIHEAQAEASSGPFVILGGS